MHPVLALVNTDMLNNALLSFHPPGLLKDMDISNSFREALMDVNKFRDLTLLAEYSKERRWRPSLRWPPP